MGPAASSADRQGIVSASRDRALVPDDELLLRRLIGGDPGAAAPDPAAGRGRALADAAGGGRVGSTPPTARPARRVHCDRWVRPPLPAPRPCSTGLAPERRRLGRAPARRHRRRIPRRQHDRLDALVRDHLADHPGTSSRRGSPPNPPAGNPTQPSPTDGAAVSFTADRHSRARPPTTTGPVAGRWMVSFLGFPIGGVTRPSSSSARSTASSPPSSAVPSTGAVLGAVAGRGASAGAAPPRRQWIWPPRSA